MGDYKRYYETLLACCNRIRDLCQSKDASKARKEIVELVKQRFIDEDEFDELCNQIDNTQPNKDGKRIIKTTNDVYATGTIALYMILDDIDTLDDMAREDDSNFIQQAQKRLDYALIVAGEGGVPRKIRIQIGMLTTVELLK